MGKPRPTRIWNTPTSVLRNYEETSFVKLQSRRERLQQVLERRQQTAVTEASTTTSTPTPTAVPETTQATPEAIPDTKEPKKKKKKKKSKN